MNRIATYTDTVRAHHKPQKREPKTKHGLGRKPSAKKEREIKEDQKYYEDAILEAIARDKGFPKCQECEEPIRNTSGGRNVCHIIGKGADKRMYHDLLNHFILCDYGAGNCKAKFDDQGKQSEMKIYPEFIRRRELLHDKFKTKKVVRV